MKKLNSTQVKNGDIVRLRDGTICEVMSQLSDGNFDCRPTDEHPHKTRTGNVCQEGCVSDQVIESGCDIVEVVVNVQAVDPEVLLQKACQQSTKCDTCLHQYQAR